VTALERLTRALVEGGRVAGDGLEWAAAVSAHTPLSAVGTWGRDGWDLGRWPLVVVATGEAHDAHVLAVYVYVSTFATADELTAAVDLEAFHWWESLGNGPDVSGYQSVDDLPAELRGPFSTARLDRERDGGGS
jgi:hypothetical protein